MKRTTIERTTIKRTAMRATEHTVARVVAAGGLLASVGYLLWRVTFSLVGTDLWLSLPVVAVEVAGFLGSATLVWALWPRLGEQAGQVGADAAARNVPAVDVVVRIDGRSENELRATLIALRSVSQVNDVLVVDLSPRQAVAAIADEFAATYAAAAPADFSGMAFAVANSRTPRFLLLDAGDVPTTDIVTRLTSAVADERVAVAQGLGVSSADDSIEHGPDGRHDLSFERSALNPMLGLRGCAFWTGSGSLVSVDALREVLAAKEVLSNHISTASPCSSLEQHWAVSSRLFAAGWRIVAPVDVAVVAHRVEPLESVVYADRRARVRTARRLVAGWRQHCSARQRMAILAWCVRPLSGLRRAAFIAVLALALYAGSPPFNAPLPLMLAAWLPSFVATSVGLGLLSGWRLHPGDRTRWSLLLMGPACSSWRSSFNPVSAAPGSQFGVGLVVGITAICVVLVLRGISDQFTHALGHMAREVLLGLIVVALWTLALALDVLRLLARRTQSRRSARVMSSMAAVLGERSAKIVDLTPQGAGLLSQTAFAVGERTLLVSSIATASGDTAMQIHCEVRSVTAIEGGCWRIGVEFGEVDDQLANALAEFCTVEPLLERLGVMPGTSVNDARRIDWVRESDEAFIGRGTLRLLATMALIGAAGSSVTGQVSWHGWMVVSFAAALGISLLVGLVTSRVGQPSSSLSPDFAIRYPTARSARG